MNKKNTYGRLELAVPDRAVKKTRNLVPIANFLILANCAVFGSCNGNGVSKITSNIISIK